MELYEIRVLPENGAGQTILEVMHLSDYAAIRAAKKIAENHEFEVWRGSECIYGLSTHTYAPQQTGIYAR